jgi:alpha-tubulin suppressor-like RCC1 family protein
MLRRSRTAMLGTIVFATSFVAVAADMPTAHAAGAQLVSLGSATIWEGHAKNRTVAVPVTLTAPQASPVSVTYTVAEGTATAGKPTQAAATADFTSKTGTLSFPANVVVKYVAVTIFGDTRDESDETVQITLGSATGAALGNDSATVTINDDDDGSPPATLATIGDATIVEGDTNVRAVKFELNLSRSAGAPVTIGYRIVAGTATGGWSGAYAAPPGVDIGDRLGQTKFLTFNATAVHKFIVVKVAPDALGEGDENFTVVLDSITGPATIADGSATGTILDDELLSLDLTIAGTGSGTVTRTPGDPCVASCSVDYAGGVEVTLSATPDPGSNFVGWGGACSGIADCVVSMTTAQSVTATFDVGGTTWVDISAGRDHTCGVTTGGAAYCWGDNTRGQLGDSTNDASLFPVPVTGLGSGVAQISAGMLHTCAITTTGNAFCWGDGQFGALGNDGTANSNVPVAVTGLTGNTSAISAGDSTTCAIVSGGAQCWGNNFFGQVGDGTTTSRDTPTPVSGLTSGVARVAVGFAESCATTTTGGALCWGHREGATPTGIVGFGSGVATIAVGGVGQFGPASHVCLTTTTGAAHCLGANSHGELGNATTTGTSTPVAVTGLGSDTADMRAGGYIDGGFSCAVTTAGAVSCTGFNGHGQLGDGTTTEAHTVVPVSGLASGVLQVTTGASHACARTATGAYCWGWNPAGQLGDGTTTTRMAPVSVLAP